MAEPHARRFDFAVSLDGAGRVAAESGGEIEVPEQWAPEHLVLAGLARCSLTSLRYHARRAGIEVAASGEASGTVTKREDDGRYAFVEIECRFDVRLDPKPGDAEVAELLSNAERDCFVGASLTAKPRYVWNVA